MMRILLLNTSFRQEGPNNTLVEIAKGGTRVGMEIWAGALSGRGPVEGVYRRLGVPTVYFGRPGLSDVLVASRVARFLADRGINVLHAQLLRGEVVGALAARRVASCRLLCTVQNEDPYRIIWRNPPKALLSRWALGKADKVVAVSSPLREFLIRYQAVDPSVIEVIPNGIDPARYATRGAASRPEDLPEGDPLIGCVGRLSAQKGQSALISAFHRLVTVMPRARLILIGTGPDERALRALAASGNGNSRIHFLGWRDPVAPYLAFLDVYVQPSFWEGTPFATMEAMASGVAVVGSATGGLRDLVTEGNGLLVTPGDVDALFESISRISRDQAARAALTRTARQKIHREHRADQMAAAYLRTYQSMRSKGSNDG